MIKLNNVLNPICRYKTVLGELVHTDNLFSSCSLKTMEEALFCHSGLKGTMVEGAGSWDAYWERNDPLRDIDEVAIPVLCVCSQDDPIRGDDQATLPLELFESNPHFFLLLTAHGGHCGFSTSDEGPIVWSHQALLEFFRATTDFFAAEERAKLAARRRGVSGTGKTFRHRSVSTCKRLPVCSHNIHAIYNWQRSYTRWWCAQRVSYVVWDLGETEIAKNTARKWLDLNPLSELLFIAAKKTSQNVSVYIQDYLEVDYHLQRLDSECLWGC